MIVTRSNRLSSLDVGRGGKRRRAPSSPRFSIGRRATLAKRVRKPWPLSGSWREASRSCRPRARRSWLVDGVGTALKPEEMLTRSSGRRTDGISVLWPVVSGMALTLDLPTRKAMNTLRCLSPPCAAPPEHATGTYLMTLDSVFLFILYPKKSPALTWRSGSMAVLSACRASIMAARGIPAASRTQRTDRRRDPTREACG